MSTSRSTEPNTHRRDARWLSFDAYVFDIDGTLLNSRDLVHYRAFQTALMEVYGSTRDVSEVPVHGNTDIGILRATARLAGVDDATFEQHLPEALQCMRRSAHANAIDFRVRVCPAIPRLLETLRRRGKLLGVATGNLEEIGWPKLAAGGLKQYFHFGSFSDRCPSFTGTFCGAEISRRREGNEPSLAARQTLAGCIHEHRFEIFSNAIAEARRRLGPDASVCFVGDTPTDISAARANACPIIAVSTGIYPLDQLAALGPDFCVSCCADLFN
jgi:phosphoglycolate phosphatase-like HAD superfamily hydrolase